MSPEFNVLHSEASTLGGHETHTAGEDIPLLEQNFTTQSLPPQVMGASLGTPDLVSCETIEAAAASSVHSA
jgi:hypothetical protein